MRFLLEPKVVTTAMDDGGLVLLSERSGTMYRCNATAAAMWTALRQHDGDLDAAAQSVADQYSAEPARVRSDFGELIAKWQTAGLVRASS